ncbi:hypothetical protein [Nocardia africana]|uniref:Lipoprotein LpqN n=1 Tax=Nocardia africana TaxID=134964 RepID=A0ABW6NR18_9NOCA
MDADRGSETTTLWTVAIVATGFWRHGSSTTDLPLPSADLRNYRAVDDLCATADLTPATSLGFTTNVPTDGSKNPRSSVTRHPAADWMSCAIELTAPGTTSGSPVIAHLAKSVALSKQTDPGPEFVTTYASDLRNDVDGMRDPQIGHVTGLGDDAYRIVYPNPAPTRRKTWVQLSMREGWVVYTTSWEEETGGSDPATTVPSDSEALGILQRSAVGTLSRLRG